MTLSCPHSRSTEFVETSVAFVGIRTSNHSPHSLIRRLKAYHNRSIVKLQHCCNGNVPLQRHRVHCVMPRQQCIPAPRMFTSGCTQDGNSAHIDRPPPCSMLGGGAHLSLSHGESKLSTLPSCGKFRSGTASGISIFSNLMF